MAKSLKAARFKERVTIQQMTTTPDGGGGVNETWGALAEVWAAVEPLNGAERWKAEQLQSLITHRVVIRYRPDITVQMRMRLLYGARILEITGITDPEERHEYLELMCEERR